MGVGRRLVGSIYCKAFVCFYCFGKSCLIFPNKCYNIYYYISQILTNFFVKTMWLIFLITSHYMLS